MSVDNAIGIYIHIPFCRQKCPYCDFNSFPVDSAAVAPVRYIDAVCAELKQCLSTPRWQNRRVRSIYLGGGTPTALEPALLETLLKELLLFDAGGESEVTVEANPETLIGAKGEELAAACRAAGANRLSLGVQSFQNHKLRSLGRSHSAEDCIEALKSARRAGFSNISIDLIFGAPGENLETWQRDIEQTLVEDPSHISAYSLSLNEGCAWHERWRSGELQLPDDSAQEALYIEAARSFCSHGFEHYEISNYAKPGLRSHHNQNYWLGADYLGLGAGAHSFFSAAGKYHGFRWANIHSPAGYADAILSGKSKYEMIERIDRPQAMEEFFMLRLRHADGFSRAEFNDAFGIPLPEKALSLMDALANKDIVQQTNSTISLTRKGFLLADKVIEELSLCFD